MGDKPQDMLVLGTCAWRTVEAETVWSIEKAHQRGLPFIWVPQIGDALIGRSRSILCTKFLKLPADYMIFVDSDIVFEPEDIIRLYKDMKVGGHELIGGLYTVRGGKFLAHMGVEGTLIADGSIREVHYLSTGFMGIAKSLLLRMVEELKMPLCHPGSDVFECYPFFENTAQYVEWRGEYIYESEDWDFCRKARMVGATPMADTGIRVLHKGEKLWGFDDQPKSASMPISAEEARLHDERAAAKPNRESRRARRGR